MITTYHMFSCRNTTALRVFAGIVFAAAIHGATLEPPPFALGDDVAPRYYKLDLTVDPARDRYQGRMLIDIELSKPTQIIWLNATNLKIIEASIDDGKRTAPARVIALGGEFVGLETSSRITSRTAVLSLRFEAPLADRAVVGPYRLKFDDDWYVFTTFTPNGARSAFPCFDQPRFKTPWQLSIHIRRELKAFANAADVKETEEPGGMKVVEFAPTPPLSSEIVAFAVGPFDIYQGAPAGRAPTAIRIITPRGHSGEAHDAALSSEAIMARLEAYTGIPYPFGKLDQVALPQAPFGAIENPGLITYRMRQLLVPADTATPAQQRQVRAIESHEMAHQWFGDYVTQATWEDVWLSEGFATWLSAKVMDEEEPAARKRLAATAARELIMASDGGPKSRPVRSLITSRHDFASVYNQFVYQKGAAILVMLENWLGPQTFQRGLRRYLQDHPYSNANTGELAAALRIVSQTDPAEVMRDFLDQTGVPEITAEIHCEPGTDPRIVFEQTNQVAHWNVPVCWKTDAASGCAVVDSRRQIEMPPGTSCPAWVLPNANGAGYYRTRFDVPQATALMSLALRHLTAAERLTLLYDIAGLRGAEADRKSALEKLARDPEPEIAAAATAVLTK